MVIRGLSILCFAAVITFASWLVLPDEVVVFGILHLIGCATILAFPFVVLKIPAHIPFVTGIIVIAISPLVSPVRYPALLIPFEASPRWDLPRLTMSRSSPGLV